MKYTHVIWDFNGTLMDDADIALAAVNDMLEKRGMKPTDKQAYRSMMTSPIIEYYKKIFDLTVVPFEDITREFLESYNKRMHMCRPVEGAAEALAAFDKGGTEQIVLSSFEQSRLEMLVESLGIGRYFSEVSGADNTRSEGKLDRGLDWLERSGAVPEKVLVIGDLIHDYELACHLGADCCLVASGHQSRDELERSGARVFESIGEMMESLGNE